MVRLLRYLNNDKILADCHYGFRQGSSTIDGVVNLISFIGNCDWIEVYKHSNVFLDLTKV